MLELAIDSMKTNTSDIPVYLVGGGAILAPDALKGVSEVHRFPFYDAANAVGAACAQVSGVIDTFEDVSGSSIPAVQKEVEARAIAKAIAAGADPANTVIVETENIPIAVLKTHRGDFPTIDLQTSLCKEARTFEDFSQLVWERGEWRR